MPDQPPFDITQRLGNFKGAITRNFWPWRGKSNLSKFQAKTLQQICTNKDIIIAHADKNLGPVDLDTETYICWALDEHLTDVSTYVQISEQKAQTYATKLYLTIYKWTQENRMCSSLTKDATAWCKPHRKVLYKRTFCVPDQGQTLDVWQMMSTLWWRFTDSPPHPADSQIQYFIQLQEIESWKNIAG